MKILSDINFLSKISNAQFPKAAFWGSLALSLIAYFNNPILNKDGAFYLDLARTFLQEGFSATFLRYDWSWFAILLAGSHQLTTLPLELCAHLWCAFFMAGTCALSVACVNRRMESCGFLACIVVLATPAFNAFRGDILREFGFWFFCILAVWLTMRWEDRPGWLAGLWVQLAVIAAVLFRREALLLVPSLILWQSFERDRRKDWRRYLQLNAIPTAVLLSVLGYLFGAGGIAKAGLYWQLISPEKVIAKFLDTSSLFASAVLAKYSQDEAKYILGFGFLTVVLLKFFSLMGPFVLPILFRRSWVGIRTAFREYRLSCLAWVFYLLALMVFFIQLQFINSRYTSFLNWLAVPFVVYLLAAFSKEYPRLFRVLLVVSLVVMFDNVISLSAKKTHYRDAGKWLAVNVAKDEKIYYDDERIRYYAGLGYSTEEIPREIALSPGRSGEYRYFVLEEKADRPWLQEWLKAGNRQILSQFANSKGNTILIVGE